MIDCGFLAYLFFLLYGDYISNLRKNVLPVEKD
jgi:hypothetical protein